MDTSKADGPALIRAHAVQMTGRRERLNDRYHFNACSGFVADGVGEPAVAGAAAQLAVGLYAQAAKARAGDSGAALRMLLEGPGEVSARLRERCNPAATTIAGYTLDGEGVLWLMAIGDTRAALLREGELTAWTARHNRLDHSRLHGQPVPGGPDAEQALAAQLMRSVNGSETAIPDIQPVAAKRGDVVVVMSDGFEEAAGLAAIREASRVWRGGAAAVVSEAIRQSVHNAGAYVAVRDNATLLVGVVE